ncbi:MAG: AAA family ATPase [Lachnospiraceae bacterium]|nr:AAA family ATPase [Lachnospiraceae bacterium]
MGEIKVPVGRSGFADIRTNGYYYIDKSGLIKELLRTDGTQVTLFTRPRRFGKTLNMHMLAEFFDLQKDSRALFEGLSISEEKELCREWMNQYPVLFLSFRTVDGLSFEKAYAMLAAVIAQACQDQLYLLESGRVNPYEREVFHRLASKTATQEELENGLRLLSWLMAAHYEKPVILLIDEYDVPLAKASEKGYYPEMLEVMKGIMQTVKDNTSLKLAVVTGCLRIAKESIFTGTNNFVSDTINDTRLNEYFGFTQAEVDRLLEDAGLSEHGEKLRDWYDGYHFGDYDVYCPWDVMNHVKDLLLNPSMEPKNYWENTSDNSIIRMFLERTDFDIHDKFETLLSGGYIKETVTDQLTYDMLTSSEENLWSLLYLTGYLTRMRKEELPGGSLQPGQIALKIPNAEIRSIFQKSVKAWFTETSRRSNRDELFAALWSGDTEKLTAILSDLLFDTISYHDYRESFYHAFLTGLVSGAGYQVESNYENGFGRADLVIRDRRNRRAAVIEAKWTDSEKKLEQECGNALRQIAERQYAKKTERSGYREVWSYGIAFYKKQCLVRK